MQNANLHIFFSDKTGNWQPIHFAVVGDLECNRPENALSSDLDWQLQGFLKLFLKSDPSKNLWSRDLRRVTRYLVFVKYRQYSGVDLFYRPSRPLLDHNLYCLVCPWLALYQQLPRVPLTLTGTLAALLVYCLLENRLVLKSQLKVQLLSHLP